MPESTSAYDTSDRIPKDILHDLCSRFLMNIPNSEKDDIVGICLQMTRADIDKMVLLDTRLVFKDVEFLNRRSEAFEKIFEQWKQYKFRVPVYGAIIVDESLENVLLVQGFHNRISWGFPKGKRNKDESGLHCAIREVMEEVGFDISPFVRADQFLENTIFDHLVRLYIAPGVPCSFKFKPNTRGEIKEIRWFRIADLPAHKKDTTCKDRLGLQPNNFFMISPFLRPLKKWLAENPVASSYKSSACDGGSLPVSVLSEDVTVGYTAQKAAFFNNQLPQKEQEHFRQMHLLMHPLALNKINEEQLKKLLGVKQCTRDYGKQPEAIRKLLMGALDAPLPESRQIDHARAIDSSSALAEQAYTGLQTNRSLNVGRSHASREATPAFIVVRPDTSRVIGVEGAAQQGFDPASTGDDVLRPGSRCRDDEVPFKPVKLEIKPAHNSSRDRRSSGAPDSAQVWSAKQVAVSVTDQPLEHLPRRADAIFNDLGRGRRQDAFSDFAFDAPAFVNFNFDKQAIMAAIY